MRFFKQTWVIVALSILAAVLFIKYVWPKFSSKTAAPTKTDNASPGAPLPGTTPTQAAKLAMPGVTYSAS